MAIASITEWLRSPVKNFHHGRLLYEQYGKDKLTLTIIRSGSGSYHLAKLTEAMEELNLQRDLVPQRIVVPELVTQEPPAQAKGSQDLEFAPAQIRDIRDQKNQAYAKARRLFETIRIMDDPEHRLEASLELLDLMDFVQECWLLMDTWAQTGKVQELKKKEQDKQISELDLKALLKEAGNLPPNISKYKTKYKQETDPKKKAEFLTRYQDRVNRLAAIKLQIDGLI